MIYLDMDGVLADFDKAVNDLCGMRTMQQDGETDPRHDEKMWAEIRKIGHFYDRLDLMPGAKEMFDRIYGKYGDRCEILTGIPKKERGIPDAAEDKVKWTRRLLSEDVVIRTVLRKEKLNYCHGPEDVLIDDREKTIREWRNAGGTGILHTGAEKTLGEMEHLGLL